MAKQPTIGKRRATSSDKPPAGDSLPRYASVDKLQNTLASEVFTYCTDRKKASGRALGTLVEIVTFYTLCAWGLRDHVAIERSVPEFANADIRHNVEFSLHPIESRRAVTIKPLHLPVTSRKVMRAMDPPMAGLNVRNESLVTTQRVMRTPQSSPSMRAAL